MKKLFRSKKNRLLGGVIGGIAEYCGIDATLIRIFTLAAAFLFGIPGELFLAYILGWIILPSDHHIAVEDDEEKQPPLLHSEKSRKPEIIFGGVIILIGLSILFRQFLPPQWLAINRQIFFAGVLIFGGLLLLLRGKK